MSHLYLEAVVLLHVKLGHVDARLEVDLAVHVVFLQGETGAVKQ